ncbi:MAG: DUF4402 domain-containing protein [Mariniphaga sp.]|nr:DUF4402 domain-containing protein [Mariniphaga sp.]
MNSHIQYVLSGRLLMPFCLLICLLTTLISGYAQEKPPRPIEVKIKSVNTLQGLNFGIIAPSSSDGFVTIPPSFPGPRAWSNVVLLAGGTYSPALFEVLAIPGTLITIELPTSVFLSNSPTGSLEITELVSSTGSPFITTGDITSVYIGGKLNVKTISFQPPGNYGGSIVVKFTQIQQ